MTNTTRPALLGYIAIKNRHTTPAAENRMRQRLIAFADSEGYTLQGIFTDTLDTSSAKISALIDRISNADPVPNVAVLKDAEMTTGYAKLLADAGVVVLTVPAPSKDTEGIGP